MIELINGEADKIPLSDGSVHLVVTSPPYFRLRDYETGYWEGGQPDCDHLSPPRGGRNPGISDKQVSNQGGQAYQYERRCDKCGAVRVDNQIGNEEIIDCLGWATGQPCQECYICRLTAVFHEVKRVLRDDGVCFIVIGDSHATDPGNGRGESPIGAGKPHRSGSQKSKSGAKAKDLFLTPSRLALSLQADGWYVRSWVVWHKLNPMPEPAHDRPTSSHETVLLLSKKKTYFWDKYAVMEMSQERRSGNKTRKGNRLSEKVGDFGVSIPFEPEDDRRNLRDVWDSEMYWLTVFEFAEQYFGKDEFAGFVSAFMNATEQTGEGDLWTLPGKAYTGAHYATFPEALVERCIKAATSAKGACPVCGKQWKRIVYHKRLKRTDYPEGDTRYRPAQYHGAYEFINGRGDAGYAVYIPLGWKADCKCKAERLTPPLIFDPFVGSGTTCLSAKRLGRSAVGMDLSYKYLKRDAWVRVGMRQPALI